MKNPRVSTGPASARGRARAAQKQMEHAEKYAPGLSLDMPDEPVKKMARGGMTDEERYGKVGAEIRRLDPEAYKSRSDKSAEANLKLLRELRAKKKEEPMQEFTVSTNKETQAEKDRRTAGSGAGFKQIAANLGTSSTRAKYREQGYGGAEKERGESTAQLRMRGDDDESPAMKRIRIARELAKSKGPSTRYTPLKAEREGMSMAQRRMREAGRMNMGGSVKKYAKGGVTYSEGGSVSKRADGIAKKGKTRCKMV